MKDLTRTPHNALVRLSADTDQSSQTRPGSLGRRRFLRQAGGVATAALAAGGLSASLLLGETPSAEASEVGPLATEQRHLRAFQIRQQCARYAYSQRIPEHPTSNDEAVMPGFWASFSKTLPHNQLGEVEPFAYEMMLKALTSGLPEAFELIPRGSSGRLVNPQAALAFDLEGTDTHALALPAAPDFASETVAKELVELYWRAMTRDVPLSQYGNERLTNAALQDLQRYPEFSGLNANTLFRGGLPGEDIGPMISQFLWKPFNLGSTPFPQLYRTTVAGNDHLTGYQAWLGVQNGQPPATAATFDSTTRYIRNGRDLAEYVHTDYSFQAFSIAAQILLSFGAAALDDANPYKTSGRQAGFATFGSPHVHDLVARVAALALKAAWYQKWQLHRRIRPEEYAGRLHNHINRAAKYPLPDSLFSSLALPAVFSKYGSYLLPMAYPEGCPVHPAYPGGHATIAGACTTVLKAFFNESFVIPNPVVASDDGLSLQPFTSAQLTIGTELNKLASNIAYGRDTAGVHWRTDEIAGLQLGEAVALSVLTEFNSCYNEKFSGFTLTKFDGTTVTLNTQPDDSIRIPRRIA